MGQGVSLKEIVEKMNLKNLTPDVDLVEKYVQVPDINRPALQLSDILIILTRIVYRLSDMLNIRIFRHLRKRKR